MKIATNDDSDKLIDITSENHDNDDDELTDAGADADNADIAITDATGDDNVDTTQSVSSSDALDSAWHEGFDAGRRMAALNDREGTVWRRGLVENEGGWDLSGHSSGYSDTSLDAAWHEGTDVRMMLSRLSPDESKAWRKGFLTGSEDDDDTKIVTPKVQIERVSDDTALVYDRSDEPNGLKLIGRVHRKDVVLHTDLKNDSQIIVQRWFAVNESDVERQPSLWVPYEPLRQVSGYAMLDDAASALASGRWVSCGDSDGNDADTAPSAVTSNECSEHSSDSGDDTDSTSSGTGSEASE